MNRADLREVFLFTEAPEMPTKWTTLWYSVQQMALLRLQDINMMFKFGNLWAAWGLSDVLRQCLCC